MKVYRHYRRRNVAISFIILGVVGVAALAAIVWSAGVRRYAGSPIPVFLLVLIVVGINFWILGRTAVEVRLEDDGHVEFVAPFRAERIPVLDIVSIRPSEAMHGAIFVLRHRNGKIRFDPKLDGMHELITELKRRNPALELRGI